MRTTPSAISSGWYAGSAARSYCAGLNSAAEAPRAAASVSTAAAVLNRGILEIDPHVELEAAVHADAVRSGLHRVPVAQVGEVVAVHLEGHTLALDARHVSDAHRVQRVAGNRRLLLVVHVTIRDPAGPGREREARDPGGLVGDRHVAQLARGVLRPETVERRVRRLLLGPEVLPRRGEREAPQEFVAEGGLDALVVDVAAVAEDPRHRIGHGVGARDLEVRAGERHALDVRIADAEFLLRRDRRGKDLVGVDRRARGRAAGFQPIHVAREQRGAGDHVVERAVRGRIDLGRRLLAAGGLVVLGVAQAEQQLPLLAERDRVVTVDAHVVAALQRQDGLGRRECGRWQHDGIEDVLENALAGIAAICYNGGAAHTLVLAQRDRVALGRGDPQREVVLHEPGVEPAERLDAREGVLVFLPRRVDREHAPRARDDVVAADAHGEARAVAVGAPGFAGTLPLVVDGVVGPDLLVGGVRRIAVPRPGEQVARIRHRSDRDHTVDGRQQAHPALLDRDPRDVFVVALDREPVVDLVVESEARELGLPAGLADPVLGVRLRSVDAAANFALGAKPAADVEGAAILPQRVARHREAGHVDLAGALGDEVDDARGARHAEHERVGALQRLDALLVLGRHGDHADGGKAAVQPVVRKEVQLDAANVHRVVGGALRVRGRDAGHTLDRFGIALLRSLLELFSRGDRLGHRQRLLVAELLLVVLGLRHFLRARRRIRAVEGGEAHGLALDLITDLLRLADERILAGGVAREDDGDRAHGVARRIAHRQLHFKARPVGAQRGLLRGRANDLQVARVRFLADAPDVGGDDRIVGARRILDVQDRDEDRGLPRQRVVHEVLRIRVDRGLGVVLGGRH